MKETIFCDESCEYLNISEDGQNRRHEKGVTAKIPHKCKILGFGKWQVLNHGRHHPKIVAGPNCPQRVKNETN
jgi:hypothetical protein